jgi:hypothetical protein
MIVNIHAHYLPKAYNDCLPRIGGRSLPEAARSLTARPIRHDDPAGIPERLAQMDAFETYQQTFHYIRECGLPAGDVDRILHHNSRRVLGLTT